MTAGGVIPAPEDRQNMPERVTLGQRVVRLEERATELEDALARLRDHLDVLGKRLGQLEHEVDV